MMSVIIAEDELLIRMGLESSIPWNELGFEIVASVADGESAWAAWQQYHPNVLITDILMPRLDGIELIKRIRSRDQNCRIIVITCVEYFDILYKSMDFSITGYLLKSSMTRDSLYRMLNKLKAELSDAYPHRDAEENVSVNDLLSFYLIDRSVSYEELRGALPDSLAQGCPCDLITLRSSRLNPMTQGSLINILKEHFSSLGELYVLLSPEWIRILLCAEKPPSFEDCLEILENIQNYMYEIFQVSFRAAFIQAQSLVQLPEPAAHAVEYLDNPWFYPDWYISVAADEQKSPTVPLFDALDKNPACRAFFGGEIGQRFHALTDGLRAAWGEDKFAFLQELTRLRDFMLSLMPVTASKSLRSFEPTACHNAPEALTALQDAVPAYTFNAIYSKGILQSIQYMQDNYMQDISLATLAKQFNVSSNYYAVLFHQITGFRFSDFLINLRMYHAGRMLKETDLSISAIAENCGFFDAAYFSRYFKQIYGKTPREYRKKG